jgi:hypothetical protein
LFFECCVASVFWKNIMKLWACRLVLILNQYPNGGCVIRNIKF